MERTVSTVFTPLWKFIFPAWILGFLGVFTFVEIANPKRLDGLSVFGTLFGWLVASAVCYQAAQLRRVRITEEGLLVFNYLREILVPWTMIAHVGLERGVRGPSYVNLTFRQATPLGRRAMFIAKLDRNRIVAQIRHRAGIGVGSASGVSVHAG